MYISIVLYLMYRVFVNVLMSLVMQMQNFKMDAFPKDFPAGWMLEAKDSL